MSFSVALRNLSRCQQQQAAWSVQEQDSCWEAPQSCPPLLPGGSLAFPGERLSWIQYSKFVIQYSKFSFRSFRLPTILPSIAARNQLTCSVNSRTMATQGAYLSNSTSSTPLVLWSPHNMSSIFRLLDRDMLILTTAIDIGTILCRRSRFSQVPERRDCNRKAKFPTSAKTFGLGGQDWWQRGRDS